MITPKPMATRSIRVLLCTAVFLATTHPLPAPIHEVPDAPAPTPAPSTKARPIPKATDKTPANSITKGPPSRSSTQAATSTTRSRFAGTWVGTMATVPFGGLHTIITVDPTETAMAVSWYEAAEPNGAKIQQKFKGAPGNAATKLAFAKAILNGDTLTARFPAPTLGTSTWSITPQPDGVTARVRMQAFFNDFTAVFDRAAATPVAARSTK